MGKNFIYSQLVSDDNDIIGMVAYGFYKKHKIEFIESVKAKHNREPNDEEWNAFMLSSNTDGQLKKYESWAENKMATFVMEVAGEQIKQSERQMLEHYQENIKAVVPSNLKTVLLGVLGSFVFSIIITLALILGAFSEKDKAEIVHKIIDESQKETVVPVQNLTPVLTVDVAN